MSVMKNKNYWGITAILGAVILVAGVIAVAPVQEAFSLGHLKKAANNAQVKPAYNANSGVENLGPECVTEALNQDLPHFNVVKAFVVTTCLEKEIKTFNNYGVITVVEIEDVKTFATHLRSNGNLETVSHLKTITCTKTIDQKYGTMTKDLRNCDVQDRDLDRVNTPTSTDNGGYS